ncbi:MAG TPA: M56 family metallopeptidase [Thermoanaerobaculia bacterium]|nr:M56 family metallopeptidase [Thermoanaerobaculia bacterium]
MIAWGLTYLAHSSLLIAAVWLAGRFVRSASARETLWKIALVAPIITASIQLNVPVRARITLPAIVTNGAAGFQPAEAEKNITVRRAESAPLHKSVDPVLAIWATGAGLLLLRLVAGRILFLRALRDRVELLREHDRLARLRAEMSCRPLIRITESSAVGSPIAMPGWEIVVPRKTFARLSDEQKDTILAHEIAHLVRRDPLWLLAGELIKALLFVQPLNWIAQKKMKECAEFLCDDLAVRHTSNPRALAETLAELATSVAPTPRAVAAMAEGGSNLMARVARVLTARRERPLKLMTRVLIAVITAGALAVFAPGIERAMAKEAAGESMHLDDGVLSRSFEGPEGDTHTELTARDLTIAQDGSSFRFTSRDGFLRVRQTAQRGPVREIHATPARTVYRVAGVEQSWNDDAQRLLLSAFRAEKAYDDAPAKRNLKTWDATVHLTGSRDGERTEIRVKANNVRYDDETAEVFFEGGASLFVEETVGGHTRTFRRNARELVWSGDFGKTEVSSWLEDLLHEQTKLRSDVARNLGRE